VALPQWKIPLDSPWPDRLVVGKYFLSIPRNRDDVQMTGSVVWRLLSLWEVGSLI
jgi:hypothetical protein